MSLDIEKKIAELGLKLPEAAKTGRQLCRLRPDGHTSHYIRPVTA